MVHDLTARVQNAYMARHISTEVTYAKYTAAILEKLKQRRYIRSYTVNTNQDDNKELIRSIDVELYYKNNFPILKKINVISKPSQKMYIKYKDFSKLNYRNNTHQEFLLSTSKGMLWLNEAIDHKIGGKLILITTLNHKAFPNRKQGGR